jgi:xanthine dehydrogenase accessory factor
VRKLSELIVLIRGGGEMATAIAHRLYHSHFRVCLTEIENPLAICRGVSFSEAVFNEIKTVEGVSAQLVELSIEEIYQAWRKGNIPLLVDPEIDVKSRIKPDVLINATMTGRESGTKTNDAPLVIGIGQGFTAGINVHAVVGSSSNRNLGKVILGGEAEKENSTADDIAAIEQRIVRSTDAGEFITTKDIGDAVAQDEIIGYFNDVPVKSPSNGVLLGLLTNEIPVLANTMLAEIEPGKDKTVCFTIRNRSRSVAGGVLEAIMMNFNITG